MKIKIINKNNNNFYDIEDGAVFTEVKNETLDTGTIIINNQLLPIDIEPYDLIAIYDNDVFWKYMCVDTYTEQMIGISPKIYKYEISLFSETKQLEGIILPNLKITSKKTGAQNTIWTYINSYMNTYCPQVRIQTTELEEYLDTIESEIFYSDAKTLQVTVSTSYDEMTTIPSTDNLRITASAEISDDDHYEFVQDDNCNITNSEIINGRWFLTFEIDLGTLEGYDMNTFHAQLDDYNVYIVGNIHFTYKFKWSFNQGNFEIYNKFHTIECPEMQWNTPTLREVLNDLMMVVDCIPVLKNGVLGFLDLTEINEDGDRSSDPHINLVTKSKSSEDYVSEIQVKLENVTDKNRENYVTKTQYFMFDTPDDKAVLSSTDAFIKTKYPIYNLKSLIIMFPAEYNTGDTGDEETDYETKHLWFTADLCNIASGNIRVSLVSEYQEWITKAIKYNVDTPSTFADWTKYQNWSLYYTRGSNEITNFTQNQKFLVFFNINLLSQLTYKIVNDQTQTTSSSLTNSPDFNTVIFKVEYETLEGCLFRASKGERPEKDRVIIDNQTNSYVDSYSQGYLEYQKANRLGNEQLHINARYELPLNENESLIKIGDTFEDTVIYQCQYQYFKNHIEINALATKNYILREYFTGVKSKIRSWAIVKGTEALLRYDLIKYYCEFSWSLCKEVISIQNKLGRDDLANYFTTPLKNYSSSFLKYCLFSSKNNQGGYIPSNYTSSTEAMRCYYLIELSNRVVGNSFILSIRFDDNYWAGKSIKTEADFTGDTVYVKKSDIKTDTEVHTPYRSKVKIDGPANIGGLPTTQRRYADSNGEHFGGELIFADQLKIIPVFKIRNQDNEIVEDYWDDIEPGQNWYETSTQVTENTQRSLYYIMQRPLVYETNLKLNFEHHYNNEKIYTPFDFRKDSQEITGISVQFEFSSDTNNISFSKEWVNRQQAINSNNNSHTYKLHIFDKSEYDFRRPNDLPNVTADGVYTVYKINTESISNLNSKITIVLNEAQESGYDAAFLAKTHVHGKCAYLTDENNKVLLSFNEIPDDLTELTLNNCTSYEEGNNYYPAYFLYLNILKTRNKNIYDADNHYIINRKMIE